jgi:hypothetical protein
MTTQETAIAMRLRLISAKAAQLAMDLEAHRLWPGQLEAGLADIGEQFKQAATDAGSRDSGGR